jgi:hypothetical protein
MDSVRAERLSCISDGESCLGSGRMTGGGPGGLSAKASACSIVLRSTVAAFYRRAKNTAKIVAFDYVLVGSAPAGLVDVAPCTLLERNVVHSQVGSYSRTCSVLVNKRRAVGGR